MSGTGGTLTAFTSGDLVVSVVGNVMNTGSLTLDQASPLYIQELTTAGSVVATMVLPQTTAVVNGTTQYAISGEYGSASEGSLQLSGDGQSLVIVGYGVNANAFNTGTSYGNTALGQTTSIPGGPSTVVPRVVADIRANGSIDTSTSLTGIFNTNNPRSVATVNGTRFYLTGQGVKGDTTQGVFFAYDGATSATAIDTSTDTRFAEIYNGALYVSRDSTQSTTAGTDIASYGSTLPTTRTGQSILPGIDETITLTAAQANTVNSGAVGTKVFLSPENFFFASPTLLYVADGGVPKNGGVGDGGLQKWVFSGGSWVLQYTLSSGLNLVNSTTATSGTSGLIGLTGTVTNGVAHIYATTETVGELDQSYLYGINDTVAGTSGAGETFSLLYTAAPGTIVRGISFAPTTSAAVTSAVTVASGTTSSGLTINGGSTLTVANGGTAVSTTFLSGGIGTVASGGVDSGSDIALGGFQTVLGTATGDVVGGTQLVSAATAVVNNEIVLNGGTVELFLKGAVANAPTVVAGGVLAISGNATANNAVLSGGTILMQSPKAVLSGGLTFAGATPGTVDVMANLSATSAGVPYGDVAIMSGFGPGDAIDFTSVTSIGAAGTAATLGTVLSGGNVVATVSGGGTSETFTFGGTAVGQFLSLTSDGNGGEKLVFAAPAPSTITVPAGVTSSGNAVASGTTIDVLSGGSLTAATLLVGGSAIIEAGGNDTGVLVNAGGTEIVYGTVSGDTVAGIQLLSAASGAASSTAVANNDTVVAGGTLELFLKNGIANTPTILPGGVLAISGNAFANNVVLSGGTVLMESGKATISGGFTFATTGTVDLTTLISATSSSGELAPMSNFGSGDVVDLAFMGSGASLSTVTSGGNTVATVTSSGTVQSLVFAGTVTSNLMLAPDGAGGEEILYTTSAVTSSAAGLVVSGGVTSSGLSIGSGNSIDVLSGGTLSNTTVQSGGSATIELGGIASAVTVAAGGMESLLGSGAFEVIAGTQFNNGATTSETVASGGSAVVEATGTDTGTMVQAGGTQVVLNLASGETIAGIQLVSAATAIASNETVVAGGNVELFLAGAIVSGVAVQSGAQITISGRGTLEAAVLSGGSVVLQSPKATVSGTLTWGSGATFIETATVSAISSGVSFGDQAINVGFGGGNAIEFGPATSVGAAGAAASLSTVTSGGNTIAVVSGNGNTQSFTFAGTDLANNLSLVTSGGFVELVACFAAGTRIATPRGDVPVESLAVGDTVTALFGGVSRIQWIGHRAIDCARHPRPEQVQPIRIAAGAFGPGQPYRDLYLSPDHAVYVDGVLIPAGRLTNGTTIARVNRPHVVYYHIELPNHDIVKAEGLTVESFLDTGDGRADFANGHAPMRLHPDFSNRLWDALGCAPLILTGPALEAARRRVAVSAVFVPSVRAAG